MITVVTCTHCHESGLFDVELKFHPNGQKPCNSCGHFEQDEWPFYFCTLNCFSKWLNENKILANGVPCHDCWSYEKSAPTGYFSGFKQNGICKTCKGSKVVKGSLATVKK